MVVIGDVAGGRCCRPIRDEDVTAACDTLLAECLSRGSKDNMSVLLVLLAQAHDSSSCSAGGLNSVETPSNSVFSPSTLQSPANGVALGVEAPSPIRAMRLFSA